MSSPCDDIAPLLLSLPLPLAHHMLRHIDDLITSTGSDSIHMDTFLDSTYDSYIETIFQIFHHLGYRENNNQQQNDADLILSASHHDIIKHTTLVSHETRMRLKNDTTAMDDTTITTPTTTSATTPAIPTLTPPTSTSTSTISTPSSTPTTTSAPTSSPPTTTSTSTPTTTTTTSTTPTITPTNPFASLVATSKATTTPSKSVPVSSTSTAPTSTPTSTSTSKSTTSKSPISTSTSTTSSHSATSSELPPGPPHSTPSLYQDMMDTHLIRTASTPNALLSSSIRSHLISSLQLRSYPLLMDEHVPIFAFACDVPTFMLPAEMSDDHDTTSQRETSITMPRDTQFRTWILSHLIDHELQVTLETQGILNGVPGASRLTVLRTEGDGNCLAHAATLASWGIHDRGCLLRGCIIAVMTSKLKPKLIERFGQVQRREVSQADNQTHAELTREFNRLIHSAQSSHEYLEPLHIFILAHVMRRAIIVYGSETVGGGENTVTGIYLPTFITHVCEKKACSMNYHRTPLCLCFHADEATGRGHFAAVVVTDQQDPSPPLIPIHIRRSDGTLHRLPLRFLSDAEHRSKSIQDTLIRRYLAIQTMSDGMWYVRLDVTLGALNESLWSNYIERATEIYHRRSPSTSTRSHPMKTITTSPIEIVEIDGEEYEDEDARNMALAIRLSLQKAPSDEKSKDAASASDELYSSLTKLIEETHEKLMEHKEGHRQK